MTHFLSPEFAKRRDFTKRWYPDPLALDISNPKCEYCEAIEFDKLPGEEEAAVPHQPSYAALKRSAERCALCTLLCDAIIEVRKSLDARNRLTTRSGATEFAPEVIMPNGTKVMGHFQISAYHPGVTDEAFLRQPRPPDPAMPGFAFADDESVRPWLFGNWWRPRSGSGPLQLIGLGVRLGTGPHLLEAEGNHSISQYDSGERKPNAFFWGTYLRIRAEDGTFARLKGWLRACNMHHGASCRSWSLLNAPLPTRVLDIAKTSDCICLIEPGKRKGRYMALSHRWGGKDVIKTTVATLSARKAGIPIRDLPRTFADAVTICRRLGVRYLWIDSLCIIQDSREDWEREAARMADVYANSYLTIAASSSPDSHGGCFPSWAERSQTPYLSPETRSMGMPFIGNAAPVRNTAGNQRSTSWLAMRQYVYINSSWEGQSSRLIIHGDFGRRLDPVQDETLNSRGWTLQERLLSPRTIHYSADQMYWECERDFLGEDGSVFDPSVFSLNAVLERQRLPLPEHGFASHNFVSLIEGFSTRMERPEGRWRGGWLGHVQAYSRRHLTHAGDKLPALSGLAALVAARTGDEYYAGLWRAHVLEDLCWRAYEAEETWDGLETGDSDDMGWAYAKGRIVPRLGPKICSVYVAVPPRAPSWSWAKLDGFVRFVPLDFTRIRAAFVSCKVDVDGVNRFGSVKGGRMTLSVSLSSSSWKRQHARAS
ncbi:heterokaryon incompatibility protein-domain-containing protein [Corynascus similis CBS 632.67]